MTAGLRHDDEPGRDLPGVVQRIGAYRLLEHLGEGGMGVVHLALDARGRQVAIKVLREHIAHDPDARSRLAREVQALARVQDPRVAAILDADTDGPRPYIVTRYIPGPALDRVVSENGPLQGDDLLRLGRGLWHALRAIHAAGVIHRDLKPANVVLLDGEPVVIDFGIAHVADDIRLTMTGLVMGTPGYLSPEVVKGEPVTEATDWWGWAATLAFAASGAPPFGRGPMDLVLDRVRRGQTDLSGVDPYLAPLLRAALSPNAAERPHANQVVAALDLYASGAPATLVVPVVSPIQTTRYSGPSPTRALEREPFQPPQREWWEGGQGGGSHQPDEADEADEADWEDSPGQPAPRTGRTGRSGTLLALMVAVLGVASVRPVVALGLVVLWSWFARFSDRCLTALLLRRRERGRRRSDIPLALIASPWHVVTSAVATILALLLPVTTAVAATYCSALGVVAVVGGSLAPENAVAVVMGGFIGLLMAWKGPGGASLGRGSRSLIRGVLPGARATQVVVAALLVLGFGLGAWAWSRGGQAEWWPLSVDQVPFISNLFQ